MDLQFPDVMLDLESTGVDQANNAIIQIAAVKFNLRTGEISHDFFDRCLLPAPKRYWEEDCRNWWSKRPAVIQQIYGRMEDPKGVLEALCEWAGPGCTMWGKPTHFDHSFLDSYFKQFGMQIPFFYRAANDMNSFIRGRYFPHVPPTWEKDLPFEGEAHNALHDVLHQIKVLFKVIEDTSTPSNVVIV